MTNRDFTPEQIASFWEKNPVYSDFVKLGTDFKKFFEEYDEHRYRLEKHILELLDSIDFNGQKVLEIGTGQGADAQKIIERGAVYTGVDITEESIKRLKTRFELYGLPYKALHVMNAEHLTLPSESFDIVYSNGVLLVSPRIEKIVAHIHRVLRKGGKAVIMLYHKNSLNYYVSISIIRRLGIFLLYVPFVSVLVSWLTGEPPDRLNKHKTNLRSQGLSYLKMENFIHRSTDGPDNPFTSVWTTKECDRLFVQFSDIRYDVRYLNERHFPVLRRIIPGRLKEKIEKRWGWHLLITVTK